MQQDTLTQAAIARAQAALAIAGGQPENSRTGFLAGRFLKSIACGGTDPAAYVRQQPWERGDVLTKAVGAIGTGDLGAGAMTPVLADFVDIVRPLTALARMGVALLPFGNRSLTRSAGQAAGFHAEGGAIPVSGIRFAPSAALHPHPVSGMDVVTREALDGTPGLDRFIASSLAADVADAIDLAFLDPLNDGTGPAPASITYGAITIPSVGDPKADVEAAIAAFGGDMRRAHFVLHPRTAAQMAFAAADWTDTSIGVQGGRIVGIPAVCSESVPYDSSGALIVLVDAGSLAAALEATDLVTSDQGMIEMDDSPSGNSATPTTAQAVSLWQSNSVAFKATCRIDWQVRRGGGVVAVSGANYAGSASP